MRRLGILPFVAALAGPASALAQAGGDPGAALFASHCVACHQADGQGAAGIAPPLVGAPGHYVGSEAGRAYLLRVPLTGMVGKIVVNGQSYNSNMPSFASLGDDQLAAVLGYVLRQFNGVADTAWLNAEAVAGVRRQGGSPNETHKLRAKVQP
jgi:mono/diheme cytochrome c family protein